RDPRPVGRTAVAGEGRDADLLGEHGDGGGQQHLELIRADAPAGGGPAPPVTGPRSPSAAVRPARPGPAPNTGGETPIARRPRRTSRRWTSSAVPGAAPGQRMR